MDTLLVITLGVVDVAITVVTTTVVAVGTLVL